MRELHVPGDTPPHCIAFAPDGHTLAVGSRVRVRLWDVAGRILAESPAKCAYRLCFSPDGRTLASSTADVDTVHLVDARSGAILHSLSMRDIDSGTKPPLLGEVAFPAFLHNDTLGVFTDGARFVWTLDAEGRPTGDPSWESAPVGEVTSLATSADGSVIVTGRVVQQTTEIFEGFLDIFRTNQPRHVIEFKEPTDIASVALTRDGRILAAAGMCRDEPRLFWSGCSSSDPFHQLALTDRLNDLAFSPDGRCLAVAHVAGPVAVLDVATGGELVRYDWGLTLATDIAFAPDGLTLAVAGWRSDGDGTVILWDVDDLRPTPPRPTSRLAPSPFPPRPPR